MSTLTTMKAHHQSMGRLHFEGFTTAEIAQQTGFKPDTVRSVLKSPLVSSYVAGLQDRADMNALAVKRRLAEMAAPALDVIDELLLPNIGENVPPSVKLSAAKDVLDRTGYKPPERHEHLLAVFTGEDIANLKQNAQAYDNSAGGENPDFIDISVEI
jgi:hypothetical protein